MKSPLQEAIAWSMPNASNPTIATLEFTPKPGEHFVIRATTFHESKMGK
ncbi:hypothetical protein OAM01_01575 [bacterium]|nr:hypothetical protein [bacterium]